MTDRSKPPVSDTPPAVDHTTKYPPYDPDEYARESESLLEIASDAHSKKSTAPPPSAHGRLRDSCKDLRVAVRAHGSNLRTTTPTLGAVAVLLASREDVAWFDLEPDARALVDLVDGDMVVEEILAIASADIDRGLAAFADLAAQGIVAFRQE